MRASWCYGIPGKPDLGPDVPTPKTHRRVRAQAGKAVQRGRAMACERAGRRTFTQTQPARYRRFSTENGLTVVYNYRPRLACVAAHLVFNTGSGANPVDNLD